MLGLINTDLKQTRYYQEVFTEGCQEGRQEESVQLTLRSCLKAPLPVGEGQG